MEIVSYHIHPHVAWMIGKYKLNVFNMETYVYDDINENQQYLQTLDPKDWKEQDHYSVLRLSKVRYHASQELIRQAYRKQLLDHHPDKGKQRLRECCDESSDYFTNITKAFELLKDQISRNSYDSVDPEFDNSIPSVRDAKERFYNSFGPAFLRNSRWSKIQPVPSLGDDNTPIEDVNKFYDFWGDFKSWREFSYLDKEEKKLDDCRDERRYIDKLNKAERKKRSQEECKRINNLVDLAKQNDLRIIRYNEKKRADREAEKMLKINKKLEIKLAAEKLIREEKERQEQVERERQQKLKDEIAHNKNQKEMIKNKQKKEKRKLRKMAEEYNYFVELLSNHHVSKSVEMKKAEMQYIIDALCLKLSLIDIEALNNELEYATEEDIISLIRSSEEKVNGKPSELLLHSDMATFKYEEIENINKCGNEEWNHELVELLLKSMNIYPSSSRNRWQMIAKSFNDTHTGIDVVDRQIVYKAKLLHSDKSVFQKESTGHNLSIEEHSNVNIEEKEV